MTKHERKLLKAAARLEKATASYLKELQKVDKAIRSLPTGTTLGHNLDNKYFTHVPKVASSGVQLELLHTRLLDEITSSDSIQGDN